MAQRRLVDVVGGQTGQPTRPRSTAPQIAPRLTAPKPKVSGGGGFVPKPVSGGGGGDDGFSIGDIGRSIGSAAGYVGDVIKGLPLIGGKLAQTGLGLAEFAVDTVLDVPTLFGAPEFYKSRWEQDWDKATDMGLTGWDKWKFANQRAYPIFAPVVEGVGRTGGNIAEMTTFGIVDLGEPGLNYYNALKRGNLGAVLLEDIGNVVMASRAGGAGSVTARAGGRLTQAGKPRIGGAITTVGRFADEPIGATIRGAAGVAARGAKAAELGKTTAALTRISQAVPGEAPTIRDAYRAGVAGQPLPAAGDGVGPLRQTYREIVDARTIAGLEKFDSLQNNINKKVNERDQLAADDPARTKIDEDIMELRFQQRGALQKTRLPADARKFIFEMQERGEQMRTVLQTEIARIARDGFVLEAPDKLRADAATLRQSAAEAADAADDQRATELNDLAEFKERQAKVKEENPGVLDKAAPAYISPATVILLTYRKGVVIDELNQGKSFQDVADLLTPVEVGPDLQMKGYRFTAQDVEAVYRYATDQLSAAERLMIDMTSLLYTAWYKFFNDARLRGVGGSEPLPFTYSQDFPDPKFLVQQTGNVRDANAIYRILDAATASFLVGLLPDVAKEMGVTLTKFDGLFKKLAKRDYEDPLFKLVNSVLGLVTDQLVELYPNVFRNEMIYPAINRPRIIAQNRMVTEARGRSVVKLLKEIDDVVTLAGDLIGKRTVDSLRRKQKELPDSAAKYSKRQWTTLRQQIVEMRQRLLDPELRRRLEEAVAEGEVNARERANRLIEAEQRLGAMEATLRQIEADPETFLGLKEPEGVLRPIEEPKIEEYSDPKNADLLATLRSILAEKDPIGTRGWDKNNGGRLPGLYNQLFNNRRALENARRQLADQKGFETRESARLQGQIDEYQGIVDKTLEEIKAIVGDLGDPELIAFISNRANLVDIFREDVEKFRQDLEQEKKWAEEGGRDPKYGTPEALIAAAENDLTDAINQLEGFEIDLENALLDLRDAGLSPELARAVDAARGLVDGQPKLRSIDETVADVTERVKGVLQPTETVVEPRLAAPSEQPEFGPPGTNQPWEDWMTAEYVRQGFSETDARERAAFDRKAGESPSAVAERARRAEEEKTRRIRQSAVESERLREEERVRAQNLEIEGGTSRTRYEPVAPNDLTLEDIKSLSSKAQTGELNNLIPVSSRTGETLLINEGNHYIVRTEGSQWKVKPRGKSKNFLTTEAVFETYQENVNRLLEEAQQKIDSATPEQIEASTAVPFAQVRQWVSESTRAGAKETPLDLVALDVNGRTVLAPAKYYAGLRRAFPDARFVQLEENKLIYLVKDGKVVGAIMPMRLKAPEPARFLELVRGEGATPRLTPPVETPPPAALTPIEPPVVRAADAVLSDKEAAVADAISEIEETYVADLASPEYTVAERTAALRSRLKGVARVTQEKPKPGEKAPAPTITMLKTPRKRAERALSTAEKREAKAQETLRNLREKHAALDEAPEMIVDALLAGEAPLEAQLGRPFGRRATIDEEQGIYLPGGTTATARGGRNLPTELRAEGMPGQTLASYERLRETDLMPLSMTEVGQRMSEVLSAMNRNETVQQIVTQPRFATNAATLLGAEKIADLEKEATRRVTEQSRLKDTELGVVRNEQQLKLAIQKEFGVLLTQEIDRMGYEPVSSVKVNPDGTSEPLGDLLSAVTPEQVDPLTYLMRKGLAQQITQQFVVKDTGNVPPAISRAFERIGRFTSGWKSMILPFSLRWQVGDAVSNVLMAWVRGDVSPRDLAKSMRDVVKRLRAQETEFMKSIEGSIADPVLNTLIGAGLQARGLRLGDLAALRSGVPGARIETFGLRGPFTGFREKMFRLNELHNTIARLSVAMDKLTDILEANGRTIDEINPASYLSDPAIRDSINEAVAQTNSALGAFSQLSPWEKNVVRQAWPFWSWLKFINKAAAQMALDNPERVLLMANLGAMALEDEDSGMFDFLQGAVPIQGFLFDLSFLNPYQDAVLFKPNIVKALQDQIGSLSPVITTPAKAAQIVAFYATGDQQIPLGSLTRPGYLEGRLGATSRTFGDMLGELGYVGLTSFGGPARNVLRAIPFDEIPIIAPQGRLLGTDVAIGNRQVYPQGSARTTGAYAQPRLGPVAGPVRALLSTFGVPAPIAQVEKVQPQARLQRQREQAARARREMERRRSRG